jgi:hypothetical protein
MGLVERDGVIVLLGMIASIAATVAVTAVTVIFIQSLPSFVDWLVTSLGF